MLAGREDYALILGSLLETKADAEVPLVEQECTAGVPVRVNSNEI